MTDSKGKICRLAGKNATNLKSHLELEVHHSEQFKEFKENEQEKKTALKQNQYQAGNYFIVILCITWIKTYKSRRLTSCLLLNENKLKCIKYCKKNLTEMI